MLITSIISTLITIRFNQRIRLFFDLDNILIITHNGLNSFDGLEIRLNDRELVSGKKSDNVILIDFILENTGNRDIRFIKEDGQYLHLHSDVKFEILSLNRSDKVKLDTKNNGVNFEWDRLARKEKLRFTALIACHEIDLPDSNDDLIQQMRESIKFIHSIDNLTRVSLVKGSIGNVFSAVLVLGGILMFLYLAISISIGYLNDEIKLIEFLLGATMFYGIGLLGIKKLIIATRASNRFYKRQNRTNFE
jgi:hypothetical protein